MDTRTTRLMLVLACSGLAFLLGRSSTLPPASEATLTPRSDPSRAGAWLTQLDPAVPVFYRPRRNLISRDPTQAAAIQAWLIGIESGQAEQLRAARDQLEAIQKTTPLDSEVRPYLWLLDYSLAPPALQAQMVAATANGRRLIRFFGGSSMPGLPGYLRAKHGLVKSKDRDMLRHSDELVRYMSPGRDDWEHTDEVLAAMGVQDGQSVTDLGSGPGYFTWHFAAAVGSTGQVSAVELNPEHTAYLRQVIRHEALSQVQVHQTDGSTIAAAPSSMDHVFMCATFQTIYANLKESVREQLVAEILASLKPTGRLTVMGNVVDQPTEHPLRGTRIAAPVVTAFLEAKGFRLVAEHRFTPQRYTLIFERG
jgi:predicted methyltransferase